MAQTPSARMELKLETAATPEETSVRCIGKITYETAETLRTTVLGLIPETKRVVLNLADTTHLDSFGLGVLLSVYLSARRQQCQLKLINVNQQARQLLSVTNLTYLLE